MLSVHVAPNYTGGFFDGAIQVLPIFHGLRLQGQGSTSSLFCIYRTTLRYGRIHFMLQPVLLLAFFRTLCHHTLHI